MYLLETYPKHMKWAYQTSNHLKVVDQIMDLSLDKNELISLRFLTPTKSQLFIIVIVQ